MIDEPLIPNISIIVPVYNEAGNVALVHGQIVSAMAKLNKSFEIIFVDDGSTDNTLGELQKLSPVIIVCLRGRFGQSCALDAGIKLAKGEKIITLDGDGQNDPADIPILLEKLDEGFDVVCGWRYQRQDNAFRRFISSGAAMLRKILVDDGVHDAGCTLRAYRSECFKGVNLYGGMHRMIPGLLRWQGFKMTEIKVKHHPRVHGKSKYGGCYKRVIQGFSDMIRIWYWCRYKKLSAVVFTSSEDQRPRYLIKDIQFR